MKTKSRLLISLILGLLPLVGCATNGPRTSAETQPAENARVVEIAFPSTPKEQEQAQTKQAEPPAGVAQKQVTTPLEHYTVVAGDTLAKIAAQPNVYGDARLWPLLHVANSKQIGPQDLIFPNQLLTINRHYTAEDVKALTGRSKPAPTHQQAEKQKSVPSATAEKSTSVAPATTEAKAQEPPVAKKPKNEDKPADYLSAARRAFAAGDIPWSLYYYNAHLAEKKRDANAWGEMGNVYYSDGRLPDSAQAYFTAANILIDRGLTARAMHLIPAIEEGNPGLAEAIYLRLTTVKR